MIVLRYCTYRRKDEKGNRRSSNRPFHFFIFSLSPINTLLLLIARALIAMTPNYRRLVGRLALVAATLLLQINYNGIKAFSLVSTQVSCSSSNSVTDGGTTEVLPVPPHCYLHPSASIIQTSPTGERGVFVNQDASIPDNEILLRVPMSEVITPQMGLQDTPAGNAISKVTAAVDWHTSLALWLCYSKYRLKNDNPEKQKKQEQEHKISQVQTWYVNNLPWDRMDHLPIFWSSDELVELEGSFLLREILQKRGQWEDLYDTIVKVYPAFANETSFDEFVQAKSMVGSRAFGLNPNNDDEDRTDVGMVPLADMLNHQSKVWSTTCDWSVQEMEFCIRTGPAGLQAGCEAFQSYGRYSNAQYLLKYGFCIERDDEANDNTQTEHEKMLVLPQEAHIAINTGTNDDNDVEEWFDVSVGRPEAIDLIQYLRDCVEISLEGNEGEDVLVPEHLQEQREDGDWRVPISLLNERLVFSNIADSVDAALDRYPIPFSEDWMQLRERIPGGGYSISKFTKLRNAMVVRAEEKRVLHHWKDKVCKPSLDCLDRIEQSGAGWEEYCDLLEAALFLEML